MVQRLLFSGLRIFCSGENLFQKKRIAPLAPTLSPLRVMGVARPEAGEERVTFFDFGGAYDASGLLVKTLFFSGTGKYGTIATGAPQRRKPKPLERHVTPNDFSTADIFANNRLMERIPPEKSARKCDYFRRGVLRAPLKNCRKTATIFEEAVLKGCFANPFA